MTPPTLQTVLRRGRAAVGVTLGLGHWRTIRRIRSEGLSYLGPVSLNDLHVAVREVERHGIDGQIIDAGVALGGSTIVMAVARTQDRPMAAYDVFGMIPPPTEADGQDVQDRYEIIKSGRSTGLNGAEYYGYRENLRAEVAANLQRYGANGVDLVEGLFEDTLHPTGPVALAHVDGDWYESVKVCLERIGPNLSRGGRIIIDDYEAWSGCRKAVDEWLDGSSGFHTEQRARLHIVRS